MVTSYVCILSICLFCCKWPPKSTSFRTEKDTFGPINVPQDKYWGAQTQRSLQNFDIGREWDIMPTPLVYALALVKKAAACVNSKNFGFSKDKADSIGRAADEVRDAIARNRSLAEN